MDFTFSNPDPLPRPAATGLSPFQRQLHEAFEDCWTNWGCDPAEGALLVARRYFIEGGHVGHRLAANLVKSNISSLSGLTHIGNYSPQTMALSHLGERIAHTLLQHAADKKTVDILAERFLEIWHAGSIPEPRREFIPRRHLAQLFFSTGGRTGMEASAVLVHQLLNQVVEKSPGNATRFLKQLSEALPRSIVDAI